jgi:hypothetical protein
LYVVAGGNAMIAIGTTMQIEMEDNTDEKKQKSCAAV